MGVGGAHQLTGRSAIDVDESSACSTGVMGVGGAHQLTGRSAVDVDESSACSTGVMGVGGAHQLTGRSAVDVDFDVLVGVSNKFWRSPNLGPLPF